MKKVRVAFIGTGKIASLHADGYKQNPQCEVVALVDMKQEAAEAFKEKHGFSSAKIYTDHAKMLEEVKPDLVSICLWTGLHPGMVKACAEAGVPAIHCEKPMAPTWGEALEMAEACKKSGAQLTFNHQRRFLPVFQLAKKLIADGVVGELKTVEGFVPDNILDWGTHIIDLIFMFNSEVSATSVWGQVDLSSTRQWFRIPFENAAAGIIYFENGVRAVIESGADKAIKLGFNIHGTDGVIEIREEEPWMRYRGRGQSEWTVPELEEGLHDSDEKRIAIRQVIGDITACIESGVEPENSVNKALRATETIFAIYESSRSQGRIKLPLEPRDSALLDMIGQRGIVDVDLGKKG
ncbi:MAG: Gfo/Idh/MocA family oxidoreductase [Planctomycetes bacterium]|nr:Gfo/Idh/MocA family oxidoreductase [Planctomycetota bacterium]